MKQYKKVQTIIDELIAMKCDVCGRIDSVDSYEIYEYTYINFVGGYGSIFGDGGEYEEDICQYCLKDLLGNTLRYLGEK